MNDYDDIDAYDNTDIQISNRHIDNLNLRLKDLPIYNKLKESQNECLKQIVSVKRNPILYSKPGYILRVEIKGFLTHINKSIDITNVIQLIFGPNGSGKSSILESIVFCLCGEKNHIRQNLEVLSNLKTQAGLLHAQDGQDDVAVIKQTSVTVYFAKPLALRRIITEKDTSTYQICDFSEDKIKFKKISKQDVIEILHSLNHYPNNRVTMVNQQEMKQLARMQPNERYNLFSDASGLSDVMIKMKCALEDIEKIKDTIVQCQQLRNKLKEQYKDVDKKWKDAEILRKEQEILLKLQLKQESCQYGQKYIIMHNQVEQRYQLIQNYSNLSNQYQQMQQKYNEVLKNSDKIKQDLQQKKDLRLQVCQNQQQLQTNASNIQSQIQIEKSKVDILQDKIDYTIQQIDSSKQNYNNVKKIIEQYQQQPPLQQPQESEELKILKDECKQLNVNKDNIDQQIKYQEQQKYYIQQEYNKKQEFIKNQSSEIERLQQDIAIYNQQLISKQQKLTLKNKMIRTLQLFNSQFMNHDFTNLQYGILPYLNVYVKKEYQQYYSLINNMIKPEILQQLVYLKDNEYQFNKERNRIDEHHVISDVKYYKLINKRNIKQEIQSIKELRGIKIIYAIDCLEFLDQLALQHLIVKANIDQICITDTRDNAYKIAERVNKVYVYCESFKTYLYNNNGYIESNKNKQYSTGLKIYFDDDDTEQDIKLKIEKAQQQIQNAQRTIVNQQKEIQQAQYEQTLIQIQQKIEEFIKRQEEQIIQLQEKQKQKDEKEKQYSMECKKYIQESNKREQQKSIYEHALQKEQNLTQEIELYQNQLIQFQNDMKQKELKTKEIENQYDNIQTRINEQKQQAAKLQEEIHTLTDMLSQIQEDTMQQTLLNMQNQIQQLQQKIDQQQQVIIQQKDDLLQFAQQLLEKLKKIQSQQFSQYIAQIDQLKQDEQYFDNYAQVIAEFVYIRQGTEDKQKPKPTQQLFDSLYLKYQQGIQSAEQQCAELQQQFTYNINDIYAQRVSLINKLSDNSKNIEFAKNTLQSTTQILGKLIVKIAALRETCRQKICQEFDKEVSLLNLQMALQFNLKSIPKLEDFHLDSNVLQGQDKELYQQLTQSNNSTSGQDEINILLKDRDVSTLSGGEQTFTALAFIMSCIQITKSIFFSCDEWDVYLDAERRTKAFEKLVKMISMSDVQTILVTPNDVDLDQVQLTPEEKSLISVERLQGVKRL